MREQLLHQKKPEKRTSFPSTSPEARSRQRVLLCNMAGRRPILLLLLLFLVVHNYGCCNGTNDAAYQNELAEEAQSRIRHLKQRLFQVKDPMSAEHRELQAALSKAHRDLDNIRLLKRGLSHVSVMKIAAIQHELDAKRETMRSNHSPITTEQRQEVNELAQRIQALKREALAPVTNTLLPTGQPLEFQIEALTAKLEQTPAENIDEKRGLRQQIDDLRVLRVGQLERYIERDMKLLQGYRLQLQNPDLGPLYQALYREKIEAAYATMASHQKELESFRHQLTEHEV